jgi:hypothetical protein
MNGKWYQLRTNTRLSDRSYHSGRNPGYRNNLFGEAFWGDREPDPNRYPNIMPAYFQRKELDESTSSASGGGISTTSKVGTEICIASF